MPSFGDTVAEGDRWALAYYVLSLSAFKDPLSGEPLAISAEDRAALNDPALHASESHYAYRTGAGSERATLFGGEAWASRHGFDLAEAPGEVRRADHGQ
jgi:cytochrome c oxidase cbb3-type subunit 2